MFNINIRGCFVFFSGDLVVNGVFEWEFKSLDLVNINLDVV